MTKNRCWTNKVNFLHKIMSSNARSPGILYVKLWKKINIRLTCCCLTTKNVSSVSIQILVLCFTSLNQHICHVKSRSMVRSCKSNLRSRHQNAMHKVWSMNMFHAMFLHQQRRNFKQWHLPFQKIRSEANSSRRLHACDLATECV
jgi:hypothetical protein